LVESDTKWWKVGDKMFLGEYHHNIDEKNRLIIPSKFRDELGDKFIVTRGLEKCLFVYSLEEWNKIISKLNSLPFTKKNVRAFERAFVGGALLSEFDKQGRINITSPLVQYANLNHDCVIIGVNERIEIWNKEDFDNFLSENTENLDIIAENLFGDTDA
jgi:MraZ protein